MILIDTSADRPFVRASDKLAALLDQEVVLVHPFVLRELALGSIRRREIVLNALSDLPRSGVATDAEVLPFIERYALFGRGIGYVDVHLLAAVQLTAGAQLWTKDRRLHDVAAQLRLATTVPTHRGM
ncbi:MAG TPA: VapC toxin family PIN domain ribonuclease [Pseudolabrys sp.]|jgi:predicted nucleic acid-binding protein|nr:VapC toxin family PIN domain ribonuclease [Pseudolabrys sp.]